MKENLPDKIAKSALIVIGVPFLIVCTVAFVWLLNSLFGNPISKKLAENTAIEYIEENYVNENCYIEDVWYDGKYENYNVHVLSSTEDIDFSLYFNHKGEMLLIEHW